MERKSQIFETSEQPVLLANLNLSEIIGLIEVRGNQCALFWFLR